MKDVGMRLSSEIGATLKYNSQYSRIPTNQVSSCPPYVPASAHQFERTDECEMIVNGNSTTSVTNLSKSQVKHFGLGCINLLLEGRCEDRDICPHSHNEEDLQETCQLLSHHLLKSKYNKRIEDENDENNENGDDGFIVSEDSGSEQMKSEGTTGIASKKRKSKGPKDIAKKPRGETLYDLMKVENITYHLDFDQIKSDLSHRDYEESNILSEETWERFVTKFLSQGKGENILIIGSIHQTEIEFLTKNLKIKILECRSLFSIFSLSLFSSLC
jgi:hypothetical protein